MTKYNNTTNQLHVEGRRQHMKQLFADKDQAIQEVIKMKTSKGIKISLIKKIKQKLNILLDHSDHSLFIIKYRF